MVDVWPVTLPDKFQQSGFSEGVADGLIEHQTDQGPTITRRRTASAMRPMAGTMIITADQLAIFRTFFDTTILGGSLPFNFPDQIQAGTLLVKFQKQGLPRWSVLSSDLYQISLSFMVLP